MKLLILITYIYCIISCNNNSAKSSINISPILDSPKTAIKEQFDTVNNEELIDKTITLLNNVEFRNQINSFNKYDTVVANRYEPQYNDTIRSYILGNNYFIYWITKDKTMIRSFYVVKNDKGMEVITNKFENIIKSIKHSIKKYPVIIIEETGYVEIEIGKDYIKGDFVID